MEKMKLSVGQKVWVVPQSNAARSGPTPFEATVKTVGTKLFELEGNRFRCKFELESGREKSEYTSNYRVYINRREHDHECLSKTLSKLINEKLISTSFEKILKAAIALGIDTLSEIEKQYNVGVEDTK